MEENKYTYEDIKRLLGDITDNLKEVTTMIVGNKNLNDILGDKIDKVYKELDTWNKGLIFAKSLPGSMAAKLFFSRFGNKEEEE